MVIRRSTFKAMFLMSVCELSANGGLGNQTKANWMGFVDEQSRWKAQVDNIVMESVPILCCKR
jgi:hypothetical protein